MTLAIETLVFEQECVAGSANLLLMDEPDAHLHPDLQARFANFLHRMVDRSHVSILIATHSTALLSAIGERAEARLAFMRSGDCNVDFEPIHAAHRRILPVFGAHPLSNLFNEAPILLLEGEDDERIWQQAVRSSEGRIKVYPVAVNGLPNMASFEEAVVHILESVYERPRGFSLRDQDGVESGLTDLGPLVRSRLDCRAAENLLLTDDVLREQSLTWDAMKNRLQSWLGGNERHPQFASMKVFAAEEFDRRNADVKDIRLILVGLLGSNKPWEVVVGQALARCARGEGDHSEHGILSYLGAKATAALLGR
jgi:hypothetical protein